VLQEGDGFGMAYTWSPKRLAGRGRMYRQWAEMLSSGVSMVRALNLLGEHGERRADRRAMFRLRDRIEAGSTLGDALGAESGWIPVLDRSALSLSERTGRLDTCLALLADSSERQANLLRQLLSGLSYPLLVLHVVILVFPLSHIQDLVLGGGLGGYLRLKLSLLLRAYGAFILVACAGPWLFGERYRSLLERLLGCVPLLGRALRDLALARLSFALSAQLSAGMGAIDAWMGAAQACGSPALGRHVRSWSQALANGATPGELVARSKLFDSVFSEYYQTGELSGRLETSLGNIQRHYQEAAEHRLRRFAEWAPRLLYFAVVFYVAYLVITFWTGYYSGLGLLW
jgi:type II secretory pathway component PulF